MALNADEIVKVKRYLGYSLVPATALRGNGVWTLERNIAALPAEGVTAVQAQLALLAAMDAAIVDAHDRTAASQVGELKLDAARELRTLRDERSTYARELARMLDVPVVDNSGPGQVLV